MSATGGTAEGKREFVTETRQDAVVASVLNGETVMPLPVTPSRPRLLGTATIAKEEPEETPGSSGFWIKLILSCGLVLLGGVFAGLTIGLMGLDELHLRVLSMASDDDCGKKERQKSSQTPQERASLGSCRFAPGKCGSREVTHTSQIVNESLPIFLDSAIGGGIAAVVISTALIVVFGEVIPQAVCARYGLAIGAKCSILVLSLMYIFGSLLCNLAAFTAPIAWPIAKLLDYVLGADEEHTYKKAELRSFLQFHRQGEEPLRDDEIKILNGVLELNMKSIVETMTPMQDVMTLSSDAIMDHALVDKIGKPHAYMGLLLIKNLLKYDPEDKKRVSDFSLSILPEANPEINCFQALDYFQTGRAHLLLVSNTPGVPGGALGVVTLEDIIEEIIAEEIVDEFDRYEDNQSKKAAKRRGTAAVMKGIVEHVKRHGTVSAFDSTHEHDGTAPPNGRSKTAADGASLHESGFEGNEQGTDTTNSRAPTPGPGANYGATISVSPTL
ncbi:DUF21-domain-containing protein [Phellopilus nigrolimitatus]|nr:DUF21-domain-containing protein [Phellopilus nigrolimitatus]